MKDIILPSKGNFLTLEEVELMYPDVETPLLPKGIKYRPERGNYEAERIINQKKIYIGSSKSFIKTLEMLIKFCKKNKIKP